MLAAPLFTQFAAWQSSAAVFMARIVGLSGAAVTQATLSAISYAVGTLELDENGDEVYTSVIASTALTIADVISDTLLTTAPWTIDAVGRNFTHTMLATAFPTPHARYRIEYEFTPSAGATQKFRVVFEGTINEIFGLAA